MTSLPLIWKKHKHRDDFKECPHCGAPLKWIYDGFEWYPCDKEPVLFTMHPQGCITVVYRKKEFSNCLIYSKGDSRTAGSPLGGHVQHYYTCPWLRNRRMEYAKSRVKEG